MSQPETKPVLYYAPRSAPCRAVLLTAAALKLDLDLRAVNMTLGEHLTPDFLALNPLHTIPVLDDNGTVIVDSHVICCYLADKYDTTGTLYPKDPEQRRKVDACLYFDCGHLFPRLRFIVEPIIYFGVGNIPNDRVTYMQRAFSGLEKSLTSGPYFAGQDMTIADLCTIATISTSAALCDIDEEEFPKVTEWIKLMEELPYYKECNQEGVEMLAKLVREKIVERQLIRSGLR